MPHTPYTEVHSLFEQQITVAHVMERLVCRGIESDIANARAYMDGRDFDVLGVEENGVAVGYVERGSRGSGPCREHARPFRQGDLCSDSTPILFLLKAFSDRERVFVLECDRAVGIVTRGDMRKPPVRMFAFALVTAVEAQFARLIRSHHPDGSWEGLLTRSESDTARGLYRKYRERNEAIDLVECLYFSTMGEVMDRSPSIRDCPHCGAYRLSADALKRLTQLRNNLAHASDLIRGLTWDEMLQAVQDAQGFLHAVETVHT